MTPRNIWPLALVLAACTQGYVTETEFVFRESERCGNTPEFQGITVDTYVVDIFTDVYRNGCFECFGERSTCERSRTCLFVEAHQVADAATLARDLSGLRVGPFGEADALCPRVAAFQRQDDSGGCELLELPNEETQGFVCAMDLTELDWSFISDSGRNIVLDVCFVEAAWNPYWYYCKGIDPPGDLWP